MNNPHDQLAGMEALDDLLADRRLLDIGDEFLDDLVIDVRLEERHTDLLEAVFHVLLGQAALTADGLKGRFELGGQRLKHSSYSL